MARGHVKINPLIEDEIIRLRKQGFTYSQILKYLKEKHNIEYTKSSLSKLIKNFKSYLISANQEEFLKDMENKDMVICKSLSETMEIAMKMYEDIIKRLKEKQEKEGLSKVDIAILNACFDRLSRLRSILYPQQEVKREVSFTVEARKEYQA